MEQLFEEMKNYRVFQVITSYSDSFVMRGTYDSVELRKQGNSGLCFFNGKSRSVIEEGLPKDFCYIKKEGQMKYEKYKGNHELRLDIISSDVNCTIFCEV